MTGHVDGAGKRSSLSSDGIARRILWSRFLTHSGDQAWDFALPLALIGAFPGRIDIVSSFYLVIKLGKILLLPRLGHMIDQWDRLKLIRAGILSQSVSVVGATASLYSLVQGHPAGLALDSLWAVTTLVLVGFFGLLGALGGVVMEISVAQHWAPVAVPRQDLTRFNSRLQQVDLATELGSPVIAGLLLSMTLANVPLLGLSLVALWNIVSFVPEYVLLAQVYRSQQALSQKFQASSLPRPLLQSFVSGWRAFASHKLAAVMIAYALLWLSALSPHGVLLASYLKSELGVSESMIGVFRGLGAVFGLSATFVFPKAVKSVGLIPSSCAFILFEAVMVVAAGIAVAVSPNVPWTFLGLILLSRIGLYGFSLGEMQIRQIGIDQEEKGLINSFASALTSFATLILFVVGTLVRKADDFIYVIMLSAVCISAGAAIFIWWSRRQQEIK